jgi:hypothetical protein
MEGIRQTRELKMTVVCKSCTHQYGAWRDRCPACGTDTPRAPVFNAPRVTPARRVTPASGPLCIFCQLGSRKTMATCEHCNEPIHPTCKSLHADSCQQFQRDRVAALESVSAQ